MKIKKNDTVLVTAGKDRGKQGKVERVFVQEDRILVGGVNAYKRHRKPQGTDRPGEIITAYRPLPVAKVALVCPKCKLPTRVGYRMEGEKKVRVCRKCEVNID
jgi:large subunit ribosomal protein L24